MSAITRFSGNFAFLSNFARSDIRMQGKIYPTVEHAFQAAKTLDPESRERIRLAASPADAKRLGRRVRMRSDWNTLRLTVMRECLRMKFRPGSRYAEMLLATGDAELIEGNTWGDRFWGVCDATGENHLGRMLMEMRRELRR